MKLRTSFFNVTAFRKTLTRFAPVWALYTVFLLLILFGISGQSPVYMARDITQIMQITAWGNLVYAGIVVLFLFGDLYNTRLCCALHAFPIRREGWLLNHAAAGVLFSLVPNVFVTAITSIMLGEYVYLVWFWLAIAMLQYLFFFGTAVLSAMCAGNRLGMAAVYCMIQFVMVLVYSLTELIYQPLIYGIELQTDNFYQFFPLYRMLMIDYVEMDTLAYPNRLIYRGLVGENWLHLSLCAAVGLLCVGLALLVYRRRHLEKAGDFISLQPLAPAFLVIYTVAVGAIFYTFSDLFGNRTYVLLAAGIAIGFFTGKMLLGRTLRVFNKKSFLGFGILMAILAGSMALTWLDPVGIGRWVPDLEKVESAAIYSTEKNYVYSDTYQYNRFEITDKEEIAQLQEFHTILANTRPGREAWNQNDVRIRYTLTDGRVVNRYYRVVMDSPLGERANRWFSDERYIFQVNNTESLYDAFCALNVDRYYYDETNTFEDKENYIKSEDPEIIRGLIDAILADCKSGTMTQNWNFHGDAKELYGVGFELSQEAETNGYRFRTLQIWENCTNTVAYLDKLFAQQEKLKNE